MPSLSPPLPDARHPVPRRAHAATALVVVAVLILTSWVRVRTGAGRALWFDETWTGMIAGQASLSAFVHQCLLELNPPLFYVVTALTAQLFGLSNAALRLPSLLFALLAPLLPLVLARRLDGDTRLVWSGLLAAWAPALWFSHDARGYAMLLFLAVLNTLAFTAALRRPGLLPALAWAVSGSLVILTHYFAGFLVLSQGLFYLAIHRRRALMAWPAVVGFAPAAAWLAVHAGRLAESSRPELMAYPVIALDHWLRLLAFVAGSPLLVVLVAGWGAITLFVARQPVDRAAALAVAATGGGLLIVLGLAAVRPILEPKYLTVFMPGLLLGLALRADAVRKWQTAGVALLLISAVGVLTWTRQPDQRETLYSFETASTALMRARPRRLVFLWDHPLLPIEDPDQLGQVGAFFFTRAGQPVAVDTVFLLPRQDPNRLLLDRARAPGSAILWIYNNRVRGTAARTWPPAIAAIDPGWSCHDFGSDGIGILACTRPLQ